MAGCAHGADTAELGEVDGIVEDQLLPCDHAAQRLRRPIPEVDDVLAIVAEVIGLVAGVWVHHRQRRAFHGHHEEQSRLEVEILGSRFFLSFRRRRKGSGCTYIVEHGLEVDVLEGRCAVHVGRVERVGVGRDVPPVAPVRKIPCVRLSKPLQPDP